MDPSQTKAMIRCVNACRREMGTLARTVEGDSQAIASALVLSALSVLASVGNAIGASPESLLAAAGEQLPTLYAAIVRDEHGVRGEAVQA